MISVAHSPSLSAIIRPNTNELLLERRGVGDGGGGVVNHLSIIFPAKFGC